MNETTTTTPTGATGATPYGNECFKTFIQNQLKLVAKGFITKEDATRGIGAYLWALRDLQGIDEVTLDYDHLATIALCGTHDQAKASLTLLGLEGLELETRD